jgi:S1-C subfamily serine protease
MKKQSLKLTITKLLRIKAAIIFLLFAVFLGAQAPQLHETWLRYKVGKVSYKIKDNSQSGGGTGFSIKAPSGITYILTNDHVCEVSSDKRTVLVQSDSGRELRRNIIARSEYSDLCLIEGAPGDEGLSMASEPYVGEQIAVVGHPSLMPITVSRGTIITRGDVYILYGIISDEKDLPPEEVDTFFGKFIPRSSCNKPKNQIVEEDNWLFGKVELCLSVTKGAYRTNALIQPGSSGSPMVNFWGNVTGVIFASDKYHWGTAVSQQDIVDFLKPY